jgi:hypothetical protein
MKKIASTVALAAFLLFLTGCATNEMIRVVPLRTESGNLANIARVLPELELITTAGDTFQGKLTRREGGAVILRPFPYWNVEEVRVLIEEIHTIKLSGSKNGAIRGAANGAGSIFLISGILGGLTSKYDVDYEWALLGSGILSALGGLAGLVIGAIADAAEKTNFDFYAMTPPEKEAALKKIMGILEPAS